MDLEEQAINVIRGLAMDGPEAARSGHQGTAMALAPLAHVLWTRVMTYDADAPQWPDRDRFVLSAGHASILQKGKDQWLAHHYYDGEDRGLSKLRLVGLEWRDGWPLVKE